MLAQYIYRVMKWTDQIDLNYKFSFSGIFYQKYHFTSSQFVLSIHHIDIHSTRAEGDNEHSHQVPPNNGGLGDSLHKDLNLGNDGGEKTSCRKSSRQAGLTSICRRAKSEELQS